MRFVLGILVLASGLSAQTTNSPSDQVRAVVGRLELERYKAHIKGLTQFGDRLQGTQRNRDAIDWLEKQLRSFGYTNVERHRFMSASGPLENIYATKIGTTTPGEMYIVSAHMDGRGGGEAADDDGSGCAVVLELARVLGKPDVRTNRSVRFIFWNNEEFGMDGSGTYALERAPLQGTAAEPRWLGIIQHDMMMFDHGMPPGPNQSPNADINIEYQRNSAMADNSARLAAALQAANRTFAQYPVTLGANMAGTDSIRFEDLVASVSVRENERITGIIRGSNPHHHEPTDRYTTYTEQEFRFGFNSVQTTLGALGQLAGITLARTVAALYERQPAVTDRRYSGPSPAADWPQYARDYASTGYSPLSEINPQNVSGLHQICSYALPEQSTFETSLVVVSGTMYFTTSEYTYALDASNCNLRWRVRHEMQAPGRTVRGVAIAGNRLFRGFSDGSVMAYELGSGDQVWATKLTETDRRPATIAASPVAWNGLVFIGTSGAERACGCIIAALDANTGKVAWTFSLVPTGNARGAETWPKGVRVGGGSIWTSLTVDANSGALYASTGNPGPDFFGDYRPGANLFTGSVVALDAKTGALRNWYQLVPHDVHDWDQAAAPALVTTKRGRHRAMAAGKDGYLHAIDLDSKNVAWKTPVTSVVNVAAPLSLEGTFFCPGTTGGVLWNGPAFSPETNLVFVNSIDWCSTLKLDTKAPVFEPGKQFLGSANAFGEKDERKKGWITAVDADTGVVRWRRERPEPMVAGIAVTASGLVFTAGLDGDFLALDAGTGKVLSHVALRQPAGGGVITYQVEGKQRIGVAAGLENTILQTKGTPIVIVFGL